MRIRYTRLAASHLRELDRYTTSTFGEKQALRLLDRIEAAVEGLGTFPERGRKGRIAGTRRWAVLVLRQASRHCLQALPGDQGEELERGADRWKCPPPNAPSPGLLGQAVRRRRQRLGIFVLSLVCRYPLVAMIGSETCFAMLYCPRRAGCWCRGAGRGR
jgi:plasmid stabilization system protein ParE